MRSVGLVALSDQPVQAPEASRRPAAPIRDVNGHHVTEHVILGLGGRNIPSRTTDHRAELDLPVDPVSSGWDDHRLSGSNDGTPRRFEEEIGDAPVLFPIPVTLPLLLLGAALARVAVEIRGRI